MNHGMEHLRGDDNRFAPRDTFIDQHFLNARNLFIGDLNGQIAAGNHDPIGVVDNVVDPVNPFLVFDLGDDFDGASVLVQNVLDGQNILLVPDKGVGDEIDLFPDREPDELLILLTEGGQLKTYPGDIHAFAPLYRPAVQGFADQGAPFLLAYLEVQRTVVDKDVALQGHFGDKSSVIDINAIPRRSFAGIALDGDEIALADADFFGCLGGSDFRSFGVDHDGKPVGNLPDVPDDSQSPLHGLEGGIEPDDIHSRLMEPFNKFNGADFVG